MDGTGFVFVLAGRVLKSSPDWPGARYVEEAVLQLVEILLFLLLKCQD